jgi:hypothetical protein
MPAPAIVATPGSATANSYVELSDAVAYFDGALYVEDWEVADNETRTKALLAATLRLEQEEYLGHRVDELQALAWPREGLPTVDGFPVDPDTVPIRIQRAQIKLALAMLGSDLLSSTGLELFEEAQVDVLRVRMRDPLPAGQLPADVARELAPYRTTSTATVRLRRS